MPRSAAASALASRARWPSAGWRRSANCGRVRRMRKRSGDRFPDAREPPQGVSGSCNGGVRPPTQDLLALVDDHRDRHGVDPARFSDPVKWHEALLPQIRRVFDADGLVDAARKIRRQLLLRPGQDDQWPLQGGRHPSSRSLAQLLGLRTRAPRTGRLIQQPTVLQPIAHTLPAEAEANYSTALGTRAMAAEPKSVSLRQTRRGSRRTDPQTADRRTERETGKVTRILEITVSHKTHLDEKPFRSSSLCEWPLPLRPTSWVALPAGIRSTCEQTATLWHLPGSAARPVLPPRPRVLHHSRNCHA